MKGNSDLLTALNALLSDELGAVNQYMVHSEMCANWGYEKLHKHFEKRAIDEMKHAEKLIGRILFLEGIPIVSNLAPIKIGSDISKQLASDYAAELGAIKAYNDAIVLAGEVRDFATRGASRKHPRRRGQASGWNRGASGPDRSHDTSDIPDYSGIVKKISLLRLIFNFYLN